MSEWPTRGERQAVGEPPGRAADGEHDARAGRPGVISSPCGGSTALEEQEQQRGDADGDERVARAEAAAGAALERVER